jgi:hypothetical protein
LESVLVWPGSPQAPGWINLHVNSKNEAKAGEPIKNGGKPWVVGWPFKTADDLLDRMNWAMSTDLFFNSWVCMSQQSESTQKANGKLKAVRKAANATWFKAIWIDCDVKAGDPKHYHTMADAFDALTAFRHKVGLPFPSVVVNSGGGLHLYWVSSAPLSLDDWRPYADGLKALLLREGVKCDTGLTTDAARILRVPGTLNHKYSPPRPVELLHCGSPYNFASDLLFLSKEQKIGQQQLSTQHSEQQKIILEPGVVFDAPASAFAALAPDDALQAGVAPHELHLVDPRPIFEKDGCCFLRHALKTGGADFDQPQWNLSVLCTAFMENGNAIAHEISKGHVGYTAADTQALYDRKVADRADRGIGYPSCAAIESAGSKHCQGCPLFPKGKSPLNIRPVVTVTVTPRAATALLLPEGYAIDSKGKICLVETKVSKGEVSEEWKQLFHNTIDDAYATKTPEALHLHISTDKGNWTWTTLRKVDFAGPGYEKKLAEAGLDYTEHKTKVEFFLMSFLAKMKEAAEQQETTAFGWYRPKGPIEGFAYGGHIMRTDGTVQPAGVKDNQLRKRYQPMGRIADWHTAASYMFRQKRADFDAIIAVAFAAPLMELTGTTGAVLASMGEPGSGKSYAMEVAAAVWGEHKQTIERKGSTDKSLIHKLGAIGNLPAFWDEISDLASQQRFMNVSTQLSGGGEGSRLDQAINQRERGQWSTIININGNRSWRDYVVSQQQDHGAGLRRVLEYWVPVKVLNPQGQVQVSEADTARALLLHNYGGVGEQYASFIIKNLDQVQSLLHRNTGYFEQKLQPDKKENMWLSLCSTLLTGAEVANMLPDPIGFNTNRLFDFLLNVFFDNRRYMGAANVNPLDTAEDYLAQYLKERFNETIWTHNLSVGGPGRASKVEWRRLQPNANAGKGINVRWDKQSMTLRFSRTNFFEWCHSKVDKRDPNVITRALIKTYNMVSERKTLAAGTPFKVTQEMLYVVDVRPYQDLLDIMDAFEQQLNADLGTPIGVVGATGTGGP